MTRTLRSTVAVDPPAVEALAAFRQDPGRWLPTPLRGHGPGHWQIYLWAGQLGVLMDCAVGRAGHGRGDVGAPGTAGTGVVRHLEWQPLGGASDTRLSRVVPTFCGELSAVDRGHGVAEMVLAGTYEPPGGRPGSLIDQLLLHRLARRTARRFLQAVAIRLGEVSRAPVG